MENTNENQDFFIDKLENQSEGIQQHQEEIQQPVEKAYCEPPKCKLCSTQNIINTVLFLGLLLCLIFIFFGKQPNKTKRISDDGNLRIAFINSDSLMSQYLLFQDLKIEIETETLKLTQDLKLKEQSLQNQYIAYQKKVQSGNISYDDARKTEEDLAKQQQYLMALSEQYTTQIAEQEYEMSKRVLDSVQVTISKMKNEYAYDFVLGYTRGAGILYASPEHDITDEVVKTLNKNYLKSKK
jgi:outer membrane protein